MPIKNPPPIKIGSGGDVVAAAYLGIGGTFILALIILLWWS